MVSLSNGEMEWKMFCLAVTWVFLFSTVWASNVPPRGIPSDHVYDLFTTRPAGRQSAGSPTPMGCSARNRCQNGGTCEQDKCVCRNGFLGSYCEDMKMMLNCQENKMTVSVLKDVFDFYGTPTSSLHLNSINCSLREVNVMGETYVTATLTYVNRTVCGTMIQVNGSHLMYSNQIKGTLPPPTSLVVRSSHVSINFSCIYLYEKMAALPFPLYAQQMKATFMTKEGVYIVTMALYPTNKFLVPLMSLPSPIPLTEHLHVQLKLESSGLHPLFVLTVRDCWATPTMNYSHHAKYTFIRQGCQNDSTMMFNDTQGAAVQFSIQMFRFVSYPRFYLHCQVRLCAPNDSYNCLKTCWNGTDWAAYRRKRSVEDDLDLNTKIVSIGPIQHAEVLEGKKPEFDISQLLVPGALAVGCVASLFFLIAASKALKKHQDLAYPRRFSNKL